MLPDKGFVIKCLVTILFIYNAQVPNIQQGIGGLKYECSFKTTTLCGAAAL